jgi:hypothetical protein
MYAHLADLASLMFNLVVLTLVMALIGWGAIKVLRHVSQSRENQAMAREAMIAAAKARARARHQARMAEEVF